MSAAKEVRKKEIQARQTKLFNAFGHNGVLGGLVLGPTMDNEKEVGEQFVNKYYGHRYLADSFLEFFGRTLLAQIRLNNTIGWPQQEPYYVVGLLMYLTMFRGVRASEVLSVNGYPLQGYVIQRSIKDQAFAMWGAASGFAKFDALFGWDGVQQGQWTDEHDRIAVRKRMDIEKSIREIILGNESGLSKETQDLLKKWHEMFNAEAHRGLYSLFHESHLLLKGQMNISLVPPPDETRDPMFVNRSTETNWMIHKLLPFMRRKDSPEDRQWSEHWRLLDEHFRWMVEGLGGIGKQIGFAFIEMIDNKFLFDPSTFFTANQDDARKHFEGKYRPFSRVGAG